MTDEPEKPSVNGSQVPAVITPQIPLSVVEALVTDGEMEEAMRRQGFMEFTKRELKDLADIGVNTKGVGVITVARGRSFISQQRLSEVMRDAVDVITGRRILKAGNGKGMAVKPAEYAMLCRAVADMADKLTKAQEFGLLVEKASMPAGQVMKDDPSPTVASFKPGQPVQPATAVYINAPNATIHEGEKKQ